MFSRLPRPPQIKGKSLIYWVKGEGTCEPGQTAVNTGCTPASGEGGAQEKKPEKPKRQRKKPAAKKEPSIPTESISASKDNSAKQTRAWVDRYRNFEEFTDPQLNTPGGRQWPRITKTANERLAAKGEAPQNYKVALVPISSTTPTQSGEDYDNSSSRETARKFKEFDEQARSGDIDFDAFRYEDFNPILLSNDGKVLDGNHRHAAHSMNGDKMILALIPAGKGDGKIVNLREFFDEAKGNTSRPTPPHIQKRLRGY